MVLCVQSKLELLALYAPMMGAFMVTRKETIASEVLDIYTKLGVKHRIYDRVRLPLVGTSIVSYDYPSCCLQQTDILSHFDCCYDF